MTDLVAMARRINDREEAIGMLKKQTLDRAEEALMEALLQGADLIRVKATLKHGQWETWLLTHCPLISLSTAQRYRRLASNASRVKDFISAGSIRQALALLEDGEGGDGQDKKTKQWPAYMESIGRLSKLLGYVERFPIQQWPSEGVEKFRTDLEPLAAKLWPDKFNPN